MPRAVARRGLPSRVIDALMDRFEVVVLHSFTAKLCLKRNHSESPARAATWDICIGSTACILKFCQSKPSSY